MIIGITATKTGEEIQRLAISHKVAIGLAPGNGRNHPTKLDHFIFQRKVMGEGTVGWEIDQELTEKYGAKCREFWIVLHSDSISDIFKTEYAWWTASGKKCWGDGLVATRRTEKNPDGEPWKPCGCDGCPDLERGDCKPSGDLYFIPMDFPRLGSVWKLHTSGRRSIQQIYSALSQFQSTFGRLACLRVRLCVRPEKSTYTDEKGRHATTVYALNLELAAEDWRKLVEAAVVPALLFDETRKLLGAGKRVEYEIEEDGDKAQGPTITAEFYPANDEAKPAASLAEPDEELKNLFEALGMNQAQRYQALGQYRDNLGALKARLRAEVEKRPEPEAPGKTAGEVGKPKAAPEAESKPVEKQGAWGF